MAALVVSALLLGAVIVLALIAYLVAGDQDTRRALDKPFLIALTPVGVSFSLVISLLINGLTAYGAEQFDRAGPIALTVFGFLLVVVGRSLSAGLWGSLLTLAWRPLGFGLRCWTTKNRASDDTSDSDSRSA